MARTAYLDAMVAIREVVHGLELLIYDPDTGFVRSDGDVFDVFGRFASLFQLSMNMFRGFDGGLRVELGCTHGQRGTELSVWDGWAYPDMIL